MIAEFLIGRRSRANTARAYQKLAPARIGAGWDVWAYWRIPYSGILLRLAGWTLEFIGEAATNSFAGKSAADFIASFNSFVSNPWRPVIWLVLFCHPSHHCQGSGKGIEKSAKIMMPMLFVLLIILAICSISCPEQEQALIPVETGLQQSGRQCVPWSHGPGIFLLELGDGMSLYIRFLLPQ